MDFHRLGETVSAKCKFRPASSMKMTSMDFRKLGGKAEVAKFYVSSFWQNEKSSRMGFQENGLYL